MGSKKFKNIHAAESSPVHNALVKIAKDPVVREIDGRDPMEHRYFITLKPGATSRDLTRAKSGIDCLLRWGESVTIQKSTGESVASSFEPLF